MPNGDCRMLNLQCHCAFVILHLIFALDLLCESNSILLTHKDLRGLLALLVPARNERENFEVCAQLLPPELFSFESIHYEHDEYASRDRRASHPVQRKSERR